MSAISIPAHQSGLRSTRYLRSLSSATTKWISASRGGRHKECQDCIFVAHSLVWSPGIHRNGSISSARPTAAYRSGIVPGSSIPRTADHCVYYVVQHGGRRRDGNAWFLRWSRRSRGNLQFWNRDFDSLYFSLHVQNLQCCACQSCLDPGHDHSRRADLQSSILQSTAMLHGAG